MMSTPCFGTETLQDDVGIWRNEALFCKAADLIIPRNFSPQCYDCQISLIAL